MYVSIAVVRAVLAELERQGVPSDGVLRSCGITPEQIADPSGQLPVAEYSAIVETSLATSTRASFGLKAGWHAPAGAAHLLGFVLVNSVTLRDAIGMFNKYGALVIEDASWSLIEEGDEARYCFSHPHVSGAVARCEAEMVMTFALTRVGLHFLGPGTRLREARFMHAAPPWREKYDGLFGCPIVFGAPSNELVFDRAYLDVKQLHGDASFCHLLCDQAESLLRERRSDGRLRSRVKDVLKYQIPIGQAQADDVARALCIAPRTLRRKLGVLGCSLRELFDEARMELACAAMQRPEQPIKDLAYDLGFAEPSAFHRAFKRWTGITPQQFRMQDTIASAKRRGAAGRHDAMRTKSASIAVGVASRAIARMASSSLSSNA